MTNTPIPSPPLIATSTPPMSLPPGIPPTDPAKPTWALTQEQIDFLVNAVANFWPAFRTWWPIIVLIASGFGVGGIVTGRYTAPTTPTPIEKPADPTVKPVDPPAKPVEVKRVVYLVKKSTDLSILKSLPAGIVETYPEVATYHFRGAYLELPVMVTLDASGVAVDARRLP